MLRLLLISSLLWVLSACDEHTGKNHSKYAGEENRDIKSLSADDIAELQRGGGWGLAKPAELNGVPGPAHLLELKDDVPLDDAQIAKITALHQQMQAEAIIYGTELIALEKQLEQNFRDLTIDAESLQNQLEKIAAMRQNLRFTHLNAHLSTLEIISPEQIERYNMLRGYDGNPCENVPKGHDATLWRKHNNCE